MTEIGSHIRQLRQRTNTPLPRVAAFLDIDPTLLRKIETGQRNATKDLVIKLASYFGTDETRMWMIGLRDRIHQGGPKEETSKRFQKISYELKQLNTRQIQARIHKPSSPLNSYLDSFIFYRGNNKMYPYERVFPDGTVQLIINLEENEKTLMSKNGLFTSQSLKKAWIKGVQKQHSTYRLTNSETTLAIRFTTGGFYALTHIPATELQNIFIDAELIFGPSILSLRERLLCTTDISSIFRIVEEYCFNLFSSSADESSVVTSIINNINTPITDLAKSTGYSHKHMIRLFKKHVGVSPKYYQRMVRFNRALQDILSTTREVNWSDIVFDNGFYDQPHFIKEFQHFAGLTPNSYLETGSTCSKLLHLNEYR